MSETPSDFDQTSTAESRRSNIDLIYTYTESIIKSQEESLNRLDTKLSAFLAFAGFFLRFASVFPEQSGLPTLPPFSNVISYVPLLLKFVIYGASAVAVLIAVIGLTARFRGSVVAPAVLMQDERYWEEEEYVKAFIVNTWIKAEKEYEELAGIKSKQLNRVVFLICAASIAFAVEKFLSTI